MRTVGGRSNRTLVLASVFAVSTALAVPPDRVLIRDIGFKMVNLELPSGMRIVVEEDRSQQLVALVAVVDVGGAQDPVGKEGLAHLVEHLTFRGKPEGRLQRSAMLGFAAGGSWNASTSHDLTTYYVLGPTEALPQLLAIEGKMLQSPLVGVDAATLNVERGVVKNELYERDEQGQATAVETWLYAALYPEGHPYHRSVIGTEASIAGLTLTDAEDFVQKYYVPRNITLYISGDVDLTSIRKVFDATLPHEFLDAPPSGPVAAAHRLTQEMPAVPALPMKTQLETITAPSETPMLFIGWSVPGGLGGQRYLERFARTVFLRSSSTAATFGSDIEGLGAHLEEGRYGNTLVCAVHLKTGRNPEKSLEKVLDHIVMMWAPPEGSTGAAMAADASFHMMQNSAVIDEALKTESVLVRAEGKAQLIHWTGDPLAWGKETKAIYELRRGKVQSFAYEWITRDRARAVFVQASNSTDPRESGGPPEVFASSDDVPAKIAPEALTTFVHGPMRDVVHTFALKNGLDVYLVQRRSAPTVAVTIGFRGGSATSEPLGVAELATGFAGPTETRNGPASKFGGRLGLSTSADTTYCTGRAASGNLENILALVSDSVRTLHVDGKVKLYWDELVSSRRRSDGLATSQAPRLFLEHTFPGSPLGRTARAADYEKLGPGDLQTWIDRTLQPKGAALAVVGDIDLIEAEREVRDWFDRWEGVPDARAQAGPKPVAELGGAVEVVRVDRPGVKQTEIRVGCSLSAPTINDRIALSLLGRRIATRLNSFARSNLGGSYGFRGGTSFHRQLSGLDVNGTVDDKALTRVLAVASKELNEVGTVKLTDDELGLLKWRQGIASNLRFSTNVELARGIVATRLADLPVDSIQKFPELLSAVTADDVARVGGACRKTAVLFVSGDAEVVTRALHATGLSPVAAAASGARTQ
jgi:zinc protease